MLFLFGCAAPSDQRIDRTDGSDNRLLEKRLHDLSGTITLIVNDANNLHNKIEEIRISNKAVQEKMKGLEATVSNLNDQVTNLFASLRATETTKQPITEAAPKSPVFTTDSNNSVDKAEAGIQRTESTDNQLAVAKKFWDAMNAGDIQTARSYATKKSGAGLQLKRNDTSGGGKVSFGNVKIEDNRTVIETIIQASEGETQLEFPIETILVKEDGQWKVDFDQTLMSMLGGVVGEMIEGLKKGFEEMGKSMAEGIQKGLGETMPLSETKPGSTPLVQGDAISNAAGEQLKVDGTQRDVQETVQTSKEISGVPPSEQQTEAVYKSAEQVKASEDIQKITQEAAQTSSAKPDVSPSKQETTVNSEISEQEKRELFLRDNIVRLAELEFPDNKGIQWIILGFEHKAHLTHVEVEPAPANLDYPRFKFVVSFKNPETPRVIGMFCLKDGQYILYSAKRK